MRYTIEHPHRNASKTVTATAVKDPAGKDAYRIEILQEIYSGPTSMYSDSIIFDSILYEEELEGLISALQRIKVAKLLGLK